MNTTDTQTAIAALALPERTHAIPEGVRQAEARARAILAEHAASEQRILDEVLGPDPLVVSVAEIEQLMSELDDEPATFCRRFAVMRRQLKRCAEAIQGVSDLRGDVEDLKAWKARAEETLSRLRANEAA
jgi:hypothetical protein